MAAAVAALSTALLVASPVTAEPAGPRVVAIEKTSNPAVALAAGEAYTFTYSSTAVRGGPTTAVRGGSTTMTGSLLLPKGAPPRGGWPCGTT